MLLLLAFVSAALAQSSLSDALGFRRSLTSAQSPSGGLTPSQQWTVFTSSSLGRGNLLYSIPTQAADETRQILLSQAIVPPAGGVGDFKVSPDEQYVLFQSAVQSATFTEHFSVAINGGGITKISPPVPPSLLNGIGVSAYTFRPCGCSGPQSDLFYAQLPTTQCSCNGASCGSSTTELWVNNRAGQARRINKPTGQLAGDPLNKFVDVLRVYNDYFVYTLNDGPNGLADIRKLYVSDWSGNTWQVSPASQIANRTALFAAPTVTRSLNSNCGSTGTYLIISDFASSPLYQSLYVYNLDTKTIVSGNVISPALDTGACSVVNWGTDTTKLYFKCIPAGTNQENVYMFDVSKPTVAATAINGAYGVAAPTQGRITVHGTSGDYVIYTQNPVVSATQSAIFAYNVKTATNRALFTSLATGGSFAFQGVADAAGTYTNPSYPTLGTNTAVVWISVTTPAPATTSLYAAALTAATDNSAAQVVASDAVISWNGAICRSTAGTADPCAFNGLCVCAGCATRKCSGYVTFSVRLPTIANAQLHSSLFNGQSVVPFGSTTNSAVTMPVNVGPVYTSTMTNPEVPILIYQYNTGTSVNLFASRINLANANPLGPSNVAGGSVSNVQVSDDGKWVIFRTESIAVGSQVELYVAPSDGSAVGARVSPAGIAATQTTSPTFQLTTDSKYVLFFVLNAAPSTRAAMYSATLAAVPVIKDLTLSVTDSPVTNDYVVRNVIGNTQFHCSQTRFWFLGNLPQTTNPTSLYTVPIAGGSTVNVGFAGTSVTSPQWLRSYLAVFFRGQYFVASDDFFVNTGAAFMVAPLAVLMLLAALI